MRRRSGPSRTRPTTSTSTAPSSETGAAPQAAARLAARLALPVRDLALLGEALVHSSYPNEHPELPAISNERLEFVGYCLISMVVWEALSPPHRGEDEGRLTARRSAIVSTEGLAVLARRVELGDYLLLGQGADRAKERERPSVLAAAFESVVGAIYLDLGLEAVRAWIADVAASELEARQPASSLVSPKSRLQEVGYARVGAAPTYRIVSAVGPDHEKHCIVEAIIEGEVVGRGEGRNRREARAGVRAGHQRGGRAQRKRQEQPRRRPALGAGGAGSIAAHAQVGGRHLRRVGEAPRHRHGRRVPRHRQRRPPAAHRVRRGGPRPAALPVGRERVPHEPAEGAAAGPHRPAPGREPRRPRVPLHPPRHRR